MFTVFPWPRKVEKVLLVSDGTFFNHPLIIDVKTLETLICFAKSLFGEKMLYARKLQNISHYKSFLSTV